MNNNNNNGRDNMDDDEDEEEKEDDNDLGNVGKDEDKEDKLEEEAKNGGKGKGNDDDDDDDDDDDNMDDDAKNNSTKNALSSLDEIQAIVNRIIDEEAEEVDTDAFDEDAVKIRDHVDQKVLDELALEASRRMRLKIPEIGVIVEIVLKRFVRFFVNPMEEQQLFSSCLRLVFENGPTEESLLGIDRALHAINIARTRARGAGVLGTSVANMPLQESNKLRAKVLIQRSFHVVRALQKRRQHSIRRKMRLYALYGFEVDEQDADEEEEELDGRLREREEAAMQGTTHEERVAFALSNFFGNNFAINNNNTNSNNFNNNNNFNTKNKSK